jgi:hypothetical protein
MTDPNYNFDEQGSMVPASSHDWREIILLKAITSEIEYNYDVYSDEEYIAKQKKC